MCPPAGCQGYPGLNGLLRLPDYRLSSPRLLPALATTNIHFCCLPSDLSSDAFTPTGTCRLFPAPVSPLCGLLSLLFMPQSWGTLLQTEEEILTDIQTCTGAHKHNTNTQHTQHKHTQHKHTNTCICFLSLSLYPPPPPLSLHPPDLSSNTFPLEQTFQRFSASPGKAMADNAWSCLLYFPLALPTISTLYLTLITTTHPARPPHALCSLICHECMLASLQSFCKALKLLLHLLATGKGSEKVFNLI